MKSRAPVLNSIHTAYRAAFFALITLLLGMPPAFSDNVLMEELIINAQRKEELAQDVPIAVSAYNAEQLNRLQVVETLDITKLVPNMIGHNNTGIGSANAYSIRGLNNTESIATFDPPVGSYIDDIYVARQNGNNFTFFDVDRVEVLRGPQGTLFGRNTTGGAVRVLLKKPGEELGGYAEAGYGSYDRYQLRGSIDVPVSDRFLTKLSGYLVNDNGFVDNLTTGEDINQDENYGVRGAVRWLITDKITWDIAADYTNADQPNIANFKSGNDRISNTALSQKSPIPVPLLANKKQGFKFQNETEAWSVTSNFTLDSAIGTVEFITGYRNLGQDFLIDFLDGNAAGRAAFGQAPPSWGGFTIGNEGTHKQFTQEIKLNWTLGDSLSAVSGFYYFDEDNKTDFGDIFDFDLNLIGIGPPGNFAPLVLADRIMNNNTESWAVYTQADYAITDQWMVTAGLRYTDEDKDIDYSDNAPCLPGDPSGCFVDSDGDGISDDDLTTKNIQMFAPTKKNTDVWTPRIAVNFTPTDNQMYFASITNGFKSGGWNARGTTPDQIIPFSKEEVLSYELGAKTDWLDNRLRVNLTGFYYDVSDFQLPTGFATATQGIKFITQNFADLETYGLELEVVANPAEGLTLFGNLGVQDSKYRSLDPSIITQQQACLGGDATQCGVGIITSSGGIANPVRTPDYTVTLGFDYVGQLGRAFQLIPSAYLYGVGDTWVGSNNSVIDKSDGYTTYNASLTLVQTEQNWQLSVECKNCNDRKMLVSTLADKQYIQDPLTWLVRFRKDFGRN